MSCSINVLNAPHPVGKPVDTCWPDWVPDGARHYVVHHGTGRPIRAMAREEGLHASTVLRQMRRMETLRRDPLVDGALRTLALARGYALRSEGKDAKMTVANVVPPQDTPPAKLAADTARVLRAMAEPGAVMAMADGMDMGVVVCERGDGATTRTATVGRDVAQAMALRDLIAADDPTARICRYRITSTGRAELRAIVASAENSANGFAEGQARFDMGAAAPVARPTALADSPIGMLARRKDKDGTPFLSRELVDAGERLREDFELAQMGPRMAQDWTQFLTGGVHGGPRSSTTPNESGARVADALADLGPGLGDVALRCCCYLEGMESIERRMGWSARSGKIVLRIALQRLKLHYDQQGQGSQMIG